MADFGDKRRDYPADNSGDDLNSALLSEINEALGDMSLMDLVDAAEPPRRSAAEDVRSGKVVAVQRKYILVDLGGKNTGVVPVSHFEDEPLPAVGDTIEVTITGRDDDEGLLLLSRKDAVMAATWETLEVGQSVEGVVTGHNKGGLELKINRIAAFMPISQIDRVRVEADDLASYVNKRLGCRVMEFQRSEQSLIVSHRALMEQEAAEARDHLFATLAEGKIVSGTVRTIMPYGAFVDIGGADGLLHVRDMGHGRIEDPTTVVSEGQQLELKVLKVDRDERKIALGLKQIKDNPWADADSKWPIDTVVSGRITRLMDFGAFLELAEGVEGLIPIGEMTFQRRIGHPREIVSENEVVKVRVMGVDIERQRISLSLKRVGDDPWMGASVRWPEGSVAEGPVTRVTEFGAFVELAPGVEGLVHISELAEDRVRSVGDVVNEGDTIQAKVLNVDEDRRRIALSVKQLAVTPEYTGPVADEAKPEKPRRKRKKPLRGGLDW